MGSPPPRLTYQLFKLKTDLEIELGKVDAEDNLKWYFNSAAAFRGIPYSYSPKNSILKAYQDTALANNAPALPHERVFYNTDYGIESLMILTDTKR